MATFITGIASALSALTIFVASASAQPVSVEDIRVQLFYERNGELSEDITKVENITLWNTIIGEGYAKQPANSFLVSVVLRGMPNSLVKSDKVVVTVFDESKTAKVIERQFVNTVFGDEGRTVKPILIENRTCVPIRITARSNANTVTIRLPFKCGE